MLKILKNDLIKEDERLGKLIKSISKKDPTITKIKNYEDQKLSQSNTIQATTFISRNFTMTPLHNKIHSIERPSSNTQFSEISKYSFLFSNKKTVKDSQSKIGGFTYEKGKNNFKLLIERKSHNLSTKKIQEFIDGDKVDFKSARKLKKNSGEFDIENEEKTLLKILRKRLIKLL